MFLKIYIKITLKNKINTIQNEIKINMKKKEV